MRDKQSFDVEVREAFGEDGLWEVTVWTNSNGNGLGIPFRNKAKAEAVRDYLYGQLEAEYTAMLERREARRREHDLRREAQRPAQEAAERDRKQRAERAPRVEAFKCGSCDGLFLEGDEGEAVYECSRCGSQGVGEDGRRCDQGCGIFRAKVADESCPHCQEPFVEGPEMVLAADLDGELAEVVLP